MSTVSESSVPKLRFDVFDSIYRQLYTTLAITLMLDPKMSMHIMALWIWMEKSGFIDTVEKIHNLPMDLISGLADEALLCIDFFKNAIFPTPLDLSNSIPLLHFLLHEQLPLMFLPENRASAIREMKKVHRDVSTDFEDLFQEAKWTRETVKQKLTEQVMSQVTRSFNDNVRLDNNAIVGSNFSSGSLRLSGSGRVRFGLWSSSCSEPCTFDVGRSKSWNSSPSHLGSPPNNAANRGTSLSKIHMFDKRCESRVQIPATHKSESDVGVIGQPMIPKIYRQHLLVRDTSFVVPAEERTLFVTFSKGYRVNESELKKYMTSWLGDCIETIIMQETPRDEQPLYARIVFHYPETIDVILKGNERFKFSINGKHVWVRKYIPKNKRNNSGV